MFYWLQDAVPTWGIPISLAVVVVTITIAFISKKLLLERRLPKHACFASVDDEIDSPEIDYSELQRNLNEGVHALDDVRDNVQTLFTGIRGAQVLHSEVENCVNSLADELELSTSSEATVTELEKLLENETRNRWTLRIAHEKEMKAISEKCAALEKALNALRDKFDLDFAEQRTAFESILREKEDEMSIIERVNSEQKGFLSDVKQLLDQTKHELESVKAQNVEYRTALESTTESSQDQKHELELARSELILQVEENNKLSKAVANATETLNALKLAMESTNAECRRLQLSNNQTEEICRQQDCLISELKNSLERLETSASERDGNYPDSDDKCEEIKSLKTQLELLRTKAQQQDSELSASIKERAALQSELQNLQVNSANDRNSAVAEISSLRSENDSLQEKIQELKKVIEQLQYDLDAKQDDLTYKESALHEALSQAEQYRCEQKKLTDTQLEIALIESEQRIRELQLGHDHDMCQLKEEHMKTVSELTERHRSDEQEWIGKHQEVVTVLKLEVLEANKTIDQLNNDIVQLNSEMKSLSDSSKAMQQEHAQCQAKFEQEIADLKEVINQREHEFHLERAQLKAASEQSTCRITTLQADLEKAQQENCILSNALLVEESKQKSVLHELAESRRLSDVLQLQYETFRREEEEATVARVEEAVEQKSRDFEATINELVQNYDNQIKELNEKLAFYSSREQDADDRERAFTETLQESLAAVNRSKDSEIAWIQQEHKKSLAAKQAELDAARLDFQLKLTSANKALEQQAKSFEERLKAELDAQMACSSKRLEFSEFTISKLQDELQQCRSVINDLNAQVKISKFKADGAGVLLDRVHSYKTQLAFSDQEKSELLQSLENRDKDLRRLNQKVQEHEVVIEHFENAIREYEIEIKKHFDATNLLHSAYSCKISYLEACLSQQEHVLYEQDVAEFRDEQGLRQQIEHLKLSIETHEAEFAESFKMLQDSSAEKIAAIEESFKKEMALIEASKNDISDSLEQKNAAIEELERTLSQKDNEMNSLKTNFETQIFELAHEMKTLKTNFETQIAKLVHQSESVQIQYDESLKYIELLKVEHDREISKIIESSRAEQSVLIEKAKTESAKEWQALIESSEAMWRDKLQVAVETARLENQTAIQNAIEHELSIVRSQHQAALRELHHLNEMRLVEVNEAWQSKLDTQLSVIKSLQSKLDHLDRFHKPKPKAPLGERDPLTGSRPGSSSNGLSTTKRSKADFKENAPVSDDVNRAGPGSESTKTVSSRGSRSRSRRDSFGYRYWKASDFQLRSELGQGTYGTHYVAVENKTSNQYVINRISRRKIEKSDCSDVILRRIEMMGLLTHPNLRRMLGSFEDDRWIYIVQEYIPNSKPLSVHLQDLLQKKYVFPPSDVAFLVGCLANALDYVHSKGIVHCQVAVHKVLLTANGVPKLSGPTVGLNSLPVLPPECVNGDLSKVMSSAIDCWSLGVLAFTLLVGRVPFSVNDNAVDLNKVVHEEALFSSHSDPLAKSLIEALLSKDPVQRPSMSQVLQHPFIVHHQKKEPLTTIREDQCL